MSLPSQIPGTLQVHFQTTDSLVLIELDPDRLQDKLRFDVSRDQALFPHLYRELHQEEVLRWWPLRRIDSGRIDSAWDPPHLAARADKDQPLGQRLGE